MVTIYRIDVLISYGQFVPCPVLTVASSPAYRFLKRQIRWSGIHLFQNFPEFVVIHTVKGFGIVNKAEIDVFLELSCFFYDPLDVGASLVAQLVKNLPAMWETWVQSLGWEDPLEKGKATHSSILAWRIPWNV